MKPTGNQRRLLLAIALLIALLLLVLAFRKADWAELGKVLAGAQLPVLALSFMVISVSYFMRGLRWRILLAEAKTPSPLNSFWATSVGYLGNNFLPARAGDVIRVVLIGRQEGISQSFALATTISERLIDTMMLIGISVIGLLLLPSTPDWLASTAGFVAVLGSVGIISLFLLPHFENLILQFVTKAPLADSLRLRLVGMLTQFMLGLRVFANWKRGVLFLGFSVIIWLIDACYAMAVAHSLHLSLGLPDALLLLAALGLSSAVPSTPGYVGIYQFVSVTVLSPLGFSREKALAYILMFQAVVYAVVLLWGGIGLWQLRELTIESQD